MNKWPKFGIAVYKQFPLNCLIFIRIFLVEAAKTLITLTSDLCI
jgi:hypothetical protein